jgi:hypothetical protein
MIFGLTLLSGHLPDGAKKSLHYTKHFPSTQCQLLTPVTNMHPQLIVQSSLPRDTQTTGSRDEKISNIVEKTR